MPPTHNQPDADGLADILRKAVLYGVAQFAPLVPSQ
jgi:hypothetical protein